MPKCWPRNGKSGTRIFLFWSCHTGSFFISSLLIVLGYVLVFTILSWIALAPCMPSLYRFIFHFSCPLQLVWFSTPKLYMECISFPVIFNCDFFFSSPLNFLFPSLFVVFFTPFLLPCAPFLIFTSTEETSQNIPRIFSLWGHIRQAEFLKQGEIL